MISSDKEGEILRLFEVEKWPIGTIAKEVGVHHSVVRRLLHSKSHPEIVTKSHHSSLWEPFIDFVQEVLRKYPHITASRIYHMTVERGYAGRSQAHFRELVRSLRPRPAREAFLRRHVLPGEEAQVDWADFGAWQDRRLYAFVMTMSYSRMVFLRFFQSQKQVCFLQGFNEAFHFFQGCPRSILIDNLKTGVTERIGSLVRFNDDFLKLARHYNFEPKAANPYRGNEKGRVERSIRYIRDNFFAGLAWQDLNDLNNKAHCWCVGLSADRKAHDSASKTVRDAFAEERLILLPEAPYEAIERVSCKVTKTAFIRFDANDYSVPPDHVGNTVLVLGSEDRLKIYTSCGLKEIACHERHYGKKKIIENAAHREAILERKRGGTRDSTMASLVSLVPEIEWFLEENAKQGQNLGGITRRLGTLLEDFGASELSRALQALKKENNFRLRSLHFQLAHKEKTPCVEVKPILEATHPYAQIQVTQHEPHIYDLIAGIEK